MIEFLDVSKAYLPGIPVLDHVHLHLKPGELGILTGPSGAGKSTILRLILAQELPSSGQVLVARQNTSTLHRRELPFFRRHIGFVHQDFKLLSRRTVFENVALPLEILGVPRDELQERVTSMLERVGLSSFQKQAPDLLSGGEQQRVAIARALIHNPPLLVADEPTGNLDATNSNDILELFSSAHLEGTTVLIATHDPLLMNRKLEKGIRLFHLERGQLTDRTAMMESGEMMTSEQASQQVSKPW
jgi:cell division transport system ATP-binding protein